METICIEMETRHLMQLPRQSVVNADANPPWIPGSDQTVQRIPRRGRLRRRGLIFQRSNVITKRNFTAVAFFFEQQNATTLSCRSAKQCILHLIPHVGGGRSGRVPNALDSSTHSNQIHSTVKREYFLMLAPWRSCQVCSLSFPVAAHPGVATLFGD